MHSKQQRGDLIGDAFLDKEAHQPNTEGEKKNCLVVQSSLLHIFYSV